MIFFKKAKIIHLSFSVILLLIIFALLFGNPIISTASSIANLRIEILAQCGNGLKEIGEDCDGTDIGTTSCVGEGYSSGSLSCYESCTINTSLCVAAPTNNNSSNSGGGGGGGGGVSVPVRVPATSVILFGKAYPKSTVTLLKDAQVVASTVADMNANFSFTLGGLVGGHYIFSVYSEDSKGVRSSLFTFPIGITTGATTQIGGIFIAPTLGVDKTEVRKGDTITIFGQSVAEADVTISVHSNEEIFKKTVADKDGVYLYNFDTSVLERGDHITKSKSAYDGEISSFSAAVGFVVGNKNNFIVPEQVDVKGDLNNDGKINLVDFSILAYWYNRPNPPSAIDLNQDNKINLVDFSIMAYFWTG
ncbi:MAG: hypothetical protein KBD73_03565 [Candidatus Magasanikbacteria bacterium]|nr:hypothetical protein [Candidatus Magasanikbacteria bacterium]